MVKAKTAQTRDLRPWLWFHSYLPTFSQEFTSIYAQWSSSSHLEVEDIYKVPLFSRSLKLEPSVFGLPSLRGSDPFYGE